MQKVAKTHFSELKMTFILGRTSREVRDDEHLLL